MEMLYTPVEVAERLKVPRKTVLNYLRTGKLAGVKVGKHWRAKATDLEAFLKPPLRVVKDMEAEPLPEVDGPIETH